MPFHPIDAANSCIARSRALLAAAQPAAAAGISRDLERAALVMAVTAVDAYMHWLVYQRLSPVRYEGDLPKALARLELPFADIASLADAAISARQQQRDIRPWVQVKNAMQRRLLRETFQSYEQVSDAFALAGIVKGWSRTATALHSTTTDIRARLNHLVHRRNQIVHEGDIARASRPQQIRYNDVAQAAVATEVDWVAQLVAAIEQVVAAGNPR